MNNIVNGVIPPADLARALELMQEARAVLAPHLHPLTPAERKTLYKMGPKSVGFLQSLVNYATNTPAFVPSFINLDELKQDAGVAAGLDPVTQYAMQLALDLDSSQMLAGSEAMDQGTPVYKNIKFLAEQNQPAAQGAYDDLKQHFASRPAKKTAAKPA